MLRKIWPVKIIKIFWVFPIFPKFLSFNSTSKIPLAPRSTILSGQAIFKFTMRISLPSFPDFSHLYQNPFCLPESLQHAVSSRRPCPTRRSSNHFHWPTLTVSKLLTSRVCYVVQSGTFSSVGNISPGLQLHQTLAAIFWSVWNESVTKSFLILARLFSLGLNFSSLTLICLGTCVWGGGV